MYRDDDASRWLDISWNEFSRRVSLVSNALLSLGVGVQENHSMPPAARRR